jgi:hypothetical protein
MQTELSKNIEILLSLLRIALWQTPSDAAQFADIDEETWKKVMQAAAQHQVFALAFDGAMLLPDEVKPPRMLRLSWAARVDKIEKQYAYKLSVLQELHTLFAENSIKMLNFKGFALAQYYPKPEHRQFGDLDIYLFGQAEKGNEILTASGAMLNENDVDKHSTMNFKNILIENHHYFLNTSDSQKLIPLNQTLIEIAENQEYNSLFPSPFFNALEHICHSVHHFARGGISLRFLTDWAIFFSKEKNNFDYIEFQKLLQSVDLLRIADIFTSLCSKHLGLKTDAIFNENIKLENTIFEEIINPFPLRLVDKKSPFWKKFVFHLKHYSRQHKYFELMYPGEDFRRIVGSFFYHIKHPKTLWK